LNGNGSTTAYHVILCCVTKQSTESHNRGENGEVEKEKRSDALDAEAVGEVRLVPPRFALDVLYHSSKESAAKRSMFFFSEPRTLFPQSMHVYVLPQHCKQDAHMHRR